jgi:predicted naringenin-chalcone synthase
LSKIISIGTAVPAFKHRQQNILDFMQRVYAPDEGNGRKLKFLYRNSGIDTRYSVIPDYSLPAAEWMFYPPSENLEPFPNLEKRMEWFNRHAGILSLSATRKCLEKAEGVAISHLITVSCTGLSAPGLDLELLELLELPATTQRTSVNFMGCYAAVHAMKLADAFCKSDAQANVLIVCTELCTLHFQKESTIDNITSSLLFGDGAAAILISSDPVRNGLNIDRFYSTVVSKGKQDMAWELSSHGFRMTLTSYVPELIAEDINRLFENSLGNAGLQREQITHWCIHPGGKKILEAAAEALSLGNGQLDSCFETLREYGNMSSPTLLFVLEKIIDSMDGSKGAKVFGAAFGPGLTMETFILSA